MQNEKIKTTSDVVKIKMKKYDTNIRMNTNDANYANKNKKSDIGYWELGIGHWLLVIGH